MDEIKEQLEIVREALQAYDDGELSDLSAIVAIQMTVSTQRLSKGAIEWAEKAIKAKLRQR